MNAVYMLLLRDSEQPWTSVLAALPTTMEFRESALRWCGSGGELDDLAQFWRSAHCTQQRAFSSLCRKFGAYYFSARNERTFRVAFQAHGHEHRLPVSQLHFFLQAQAHGVLAEYEAFIRTAAAPLLPKPVLARRAPLLPPPPPPAPTA